MKMEEYIANFPKLIEAGKQCTHIETDVIRYVYVPIEKLFLVLITNKNSNIIEDLEVLRLLNQVVVHHCNQSRYILRFAFFLSVLTKVAFNCDRYRRKGSSQESVRSNFVI